MGKFSGLLEEDRWPFILIDRLFLVSPTIEGITLGAGEKVDEVAEGASGMGVDWIGEVGDRASKGSGMYEAGFTVGSLARKGARGGMNLPLLWVLKNCYDAKLLYTKLMGTVLLYN